MRDNQQERATVTRVTLQTSGFCGGSEDRRIDGFPRLKSTPRNNKICMQLHLASTLCCTASRYFALHPSADALERYKSVIFSVIPDIVLPNTASHGIQSSLHLKFRHVICP